MRCTHEVGGGGGGGGYICIYTHYNMSFAAFVPLLESVSFWGAEGAPILFSVLGFSMASCS